MIERTEQQAAEEHHLEVTQHDQHLWDKLKEAGWVEKPVPAALDKVRAENCCRGARTEAGHEKVMCAGNCGRDVYHFRYTSYDGLPRCGPCHVSKMNKVRRDAIR